MDSKKLKALLVGLVVLIVIVLLWRLGGVRFWFHKILGIIMPLIYGWFMAYILRPSCRFYEKHLKKLYARILPLEKVHKAAAVTSIAIAITVFVAFIYLFLALVLPQLYASLSGLLQSLPQRINATTDWIEKSSRDSNGTQKLLTTVLKTTIEQSQNLLQGLSSWDIQAILTRVTSSVVSTAKLLANILVGLFVCVYMLYGWKTFVRQGKMILLSLLGPKWASIIWSELKYLDKVFEGFFYGKFIDSVIIGFLCFLGTLVFRFPYASLISVIVGVTNFIPFFGPFIGAIPSAFLILLVNPEQVIYFLIFILALQQLDGNVIGPMILGDSTGLSSFWVLFSILFFGGLYGVIGMIIGVPLFAVIFDVIRKSVLWGIHKRQLDAGRINQYFNEDFMAGIIPKNKEE